MPSDGGLLFDPDEAVLVLVFVIPMWCLSQRLPAWIERQARIADVEAGVDASYNDAGMFTWLPPLLRPAALLRRLLGVFGYVSANDHHARHRELEATLSALLLEQQSGNAKQQVQLALRNGDREHRAKALLAAVHTLRNVAAGPRGAHHEQQLASLEDAAVALASEMDHERDERNYFQLERDKINTFWEITKKDLEDRKAELRNKDREM